MRPNWTVIVSMVLVVFTLSARAEAQSAESKELNCRGTVVDGRGNPIDDAKVTLHEMVLNETDYTYDLKRLGQIQTGTDGAFSFDETLESGGYRYAYVVAEKRGFALGFDNWDMRKGDKEVAIRLGEPKELAGIVVDENDAPLSGARVSVSMLVLGEGEERKNLGGHLATKLLTATTDTSGRFAFTRTPAGATAEFIVSKAARATVSTYRSTGTAHQKLNFVQGQTDIKLVLPVEARVEGVVVDKSTGKPVGGVQVRYANDQQVGYFRPKPLLSSADGTFHINALTSDRYILDLVEPSLELPDWVADPVEVIAEAGKTRSGIKIELSKGGVLEVKIVDAVNKKPVEKASISLRNQAKGRSTYSRSDANGIARLRLMPGEHEVIYVYKQGYSRQRLQDSVMIEEGKTAQLTYELAGMPRIAGVVRDGNGNPVEGVEMEVCPTGGREEAVSDSEGRFEVTYDQGSWPSGRTPVMFLVGRHPERNLAAAVEVDEDAGKVELKLEPGATLGGRLVDPDGKGIAGIQVRIMLRGPMWGSTIGREPAITDAQGNYEIEALPMGHEYELYTNADGYGRLRSDKYSTDDAVDNRLDTGELTLAVADLSVSGVIVDDDDKPVVGARVSCSGDGQPYVRAVTDTEGKFTLEKVCAGKIRISANKSGAAQLYGSVESEGGATDVKIIMSQRSSSSTRYVPRQPPSLVRKSLPQLKDVNVDLPPEATAGKMILVCFFDVEQRPSRRYVTQLAKRAGQLTEKGVTVVIVQASKVDQSKVSQWVKKYGIPFPAGMVQGETEKSRFAWGVRSLPWLILTDRKHVVRAAGFSLGDLEQKIRENQVSGE